MFAIEFVTSRPINAPAYYGLCAPGTYVLGRSSECNLSISSADISRQHLTLRVVLRDQIHEVLTTEALQNLANAFEDDEEPFITPIVLIVENRSQFGCKVDEIKLVNLGAQAAITSGGGTIYVGSLVLRATYRPVLVAVNDETFAAEFCDEVAEMYSKLGADVLAAPQPLHSEVWSSVDHVNKKAPAHFELEHFKRCVEDRPLPHIAHFGAPPLAKFLVTGGIDASPQCLLALSFGYTLVHPSFVFEFFAFLAENCVEPMKNTPHPSKYEPQISRLVYPNGGYARPEGRSLPFPLFPPALDTPWYKSRHRLLSHVVATFRDRDVATSLLEVATAMGARVINWGHVHGHDQIRNQNNNSNSNADGLKSDGSSGSSDDSDESESDLVGTEGGGIGDSFGLGDSQNLGHHSVSYAPSTRSRAFSGGPLGSKNLAARGSRASDVDSATGDPLLLPHQITKRQAAIEKRKKEIAARLEETLKINQARDETLTSKNLRNHFHQHKQDQNNNSNSGEAQKQNAAGQVTGGAGAGAAGVSAANFITTNNPAKHQPKRKIVILSPAEVLELKETVLAFNSSAMIPSDAQEHNALGLNNLIQLQTNFAAALVGSGANNNNNNDNQYYQQQNHQLTSPLQEDVIEYARSGWDIVSCEQLLHSLLTCEPLAPSLLDHLIPPQQQNEIQEQQIQREKSQQLRIVVTANNIITNNVNNNNDKNPINNIQRNLSDISDALTPQLSNATLAPPRLTEKNLQELERVTSQRSLLDQQDGKINANNKNAKDAKQNIFDDDFGKDSDEIESDRTPSDLDDTEGFGDPNMNNTQALSASAKKKKKLRMNKNHGIAESKPFSSAATNIGGSSTIFGGAFGGRGGENSQKHQLPEESLTVSLRLDRTKATVLSRLRKACERNVLAYKGRMLQMEKMRLKTNAILDDDKLSVVRDALQSCEIFLSHLEEAEEQLELAFERENEAKQLQIDSLVFQNEQLQQQQKLQKQQAQKDNNNNNNNNNPSNANVTKNNDDINNNQDLILEQEHRLRKIQGIQQQQHEFFQDAIEPLREAAADVAKLAYSLLRRDEPTLSKAPQTWRFPTSNKKKNTAATTNGSSAVNNNYSSSFSAQVGTSGSFRGVVQPWENQNMSGSTPNNNNNNSEVTSFNQRFQQLQQQQGIKNDNNNSNNNNVTSSLSIIEQIDRDLKAEERRTKRGGETGFIGDANPNIHDDLMQQPQQQKHLDNNNIGRNDANIHPLTNWVRYSPDIPVQARTGDILKPIVPRGIAIAPSFGNNNNNNSNNINLSVNPSQGDASGMRGGDLKGIANFRKSLMAQYGHKEGNMRFELWLGSQNPQWTLRFHAELERRSMTFSEWLGSGEEALTK